MSRFLSYTFPAGNATDVCTPQTIGAAGNLILNGNLANPLTGNISFTNKGYSRGISITSTSNLTGVNFTISGTQNGVQISTTVAGPNNTISYPVDGNGNQLIFDVITSISVNGAIANNVSIGSGWQGFFPLIGINLEREVINYTLTVASLTGNNNTISLFGTLDNIANNGSTYLNTVTNNYNVFALAASPITTKAQFAYSNIYPGTAFATINPTYSSLLVQVGTSAASITYAMKMNFIQI
jgi:hypothetical protein